MANKNVVIEVGDDNKIRGLIGPGFAASEILGSTADAGKDVKLSPNGLFLAVAHEGGNGITVLNTTDWSVVAGTPGIGSNANGCAWSPDSSLLAVVHDGGNYLTVINSGDWSVVAGTPALAGMAKGCDFTPDGSLLAVAHYSGNYLTVMNTADWSVVAGTPSVPSNGTGCAFSPDGALIAFANYFASPYVAIYNVTDWTDYGSIGSISRGNRAVFSSGGGLIATADIGGCKVFSISDLTTPAFELSGVGNCSGVAFSPDDSILAIVHQNSPYLTVVSTADWSVIPNTAAAASFGFGCTILNWPVPTRKFKTVDYAGNEISASVTMSSRNLSEFKFLISAGQAEATSLKSGDFWLIMPDNRNGATNDAFARITLDDESGDLPPLVLAQSYIGDYVTISSNLTTQSGAPGDEVVIRNWATRELVAKVVPAANGDWSAQVPPGTYDVSYIADGTAPVIHGPYTVTLP